MSLINDVNRAQMLAAESLVVDSLNKKLGAARKMKTKEILIKAVVPHNAGDIDALSVWVNDGETSVDILDYSIESEVLATPSAGAVSEKWVQVFSDGSTSDRLYTTVEVVDQKKRYPGVQFAARYASPIDGRGRWGESATNKRHPIQPLVIAANGVIRFKENKIVSALLETSSLDLNTLACMDFEREDREQLAQLIGYSLSGFGELSYVSDETYDIAAATPPNQAQEG